MAPPPWAYQVENFVTEPDEELVCSICRAVFCDPALCPCDHVFCKVCIMKWLQNSRNCPICRKRVSNSSIKLTVPIIKNLIMKLMLNCHNKSLGCKAQFSVESSEAHMKECEFEFVQCKNKPCKDKLFRKDILQHEKKDCPHRCIKCKKCCSKVPTSEAPAKHNCIKALHLRLQMKSNVIKKKSEKIKQLKEEITALKTASQDLGRHRMSSSSRGHSLTSSTLSSISPDEITINMHEYDSGSSILSDSDLSSDSIIIFTNESLDHSDDNAESDSFSVYLDNQENIEYAQNENVRDTNEYRNAESQTVDINLSSHGQLNELHNERSGNSVCENDSIIVEAPTSVFGETEEHTRPRRPVKRRPTTEKPAKRRLPAASFTSDEDDDGVKSKQCSSRLSKRCWYGTATGDDKFTEAKREGTHISYMEAGPSSASAAVEDSSITATNKFPNSKNNFHSKNRFNQKRAKQVANYVDETAMSSRVTIPSRNAVFERTLALLEQYNLESDPEWLPEYASHRGNDTTTESDSSSDLIESSNSELSDVDSAENNSVIDDSRRDLPAISDFMHWMWDSTSEDDPDWRPPDYNSCDDDV